MRYQFTRPHFPNSYVTFHSSSAYKLATCCKTNCCYTSFVRIVNLPQELAVVNAVGTNTAVRPAAENYFVRKNSADWLDPSDVRALGNRRSNTSSCNAVIVAIPKANGPVFRAADKLVAYVLHKPNRNDRTSMVFNKKHLADVVDSDSVYKSSVCCR